MLSRRSFIRASSVAVAAGALPAFGEPAEDVASLPAAIAALPSFAGRVPPFTNEERLARIDRAKVLMAENHIDAIVLANNSTSSTYFANIGLNGGERLWALTIPAKGKPFVVCPAFENARAHELLSTGPFGSDADVLTWQEDESPFELVVKGWGSQDHDRKNRARREHEVCLLEQPGKGGTAVDVDDRDTGDRGLSNDQGRVRDGVPADGMCGDAGGL